jgi:outer membrane protein
MRKPLLLSLLLTSVLCAISPFTMAANLTEVYQQALFSDPTYQQAVAQRMADKEGLPISRAQLFPQVYLNGGPTLTHYHESSVAQFPEFSTGSRGYSMTLSLNQTVFNYAQFKAVAGACAASKAADATLYAATQNLMLRVAQAYFTVLKDEDNLRYSAGNKIAFSRQYDQINQQYQVGMKTITDDYTAKAAYDSATAAYISAQTQLADDKENLRAITGVLYPTLAKLSERFPLISPQPSDMEAWVHTAQLQNWSIRAGEYASQAARENIKQQFGGNLPTVSLQGAYNVSYNNNLSGTAIPAESSISTNGTPFPPNKAHSSDATVTLNLGVPIFSGGQVVAQTNQARYNYQVALQKLETAVRATVNSTRQSYLGTIAGIQQIKADKEAIKSSISSLDGLRESYKVGEQTLVDVVNQQQKVFQAQTQYAADRYAYVNNLLTLKQATGTLSEQDLRAINAWLVDSDNDEEDAVVEYKPRKSVKHKRYSAAGKPRVIRVSLNRKSTFGEPDLTLSP